MLSSLFSSLLLLLLSLSKNFFGGFSVTTPPSPWKEEYLRLISQLLENVYLFHGKILMCFVLLFLLELVDFSLATTLVSNKHNNNNLFLCFPMFQYLMLSNIWTLIFACLLFCLLSLIIGRCCVVFMQLQG